MVETPEYLKRVNAALVLREIPDHEAALLQLEKAVILSSEDASVHLLVGLTYRDLERLSDAEASFRKVLTLQPDLKEAKQSLGLVLLKQKKEEEAIPFLRSVIETDLSNVPIIRSLVATYMHLERSQEAEQLINEALDINPENSTLLRIAFDVYMQTKNYVKAKGIVEQGVKGDNNTNFYNLGGLLSIIENDTEKAAEYFEKAVQKEPTNEAAISNLVNINLQFNKLEEALQIVENSLLKLPTSQKLIGLKGLILEQQNKFGEAVTYFEKIIDPRIKKKRLVRHYISLLRLERDRDAFQLLTEEWSSISLEQQGNLLDAIEGAGVSEFQEGRVSLARKVFEQCLRLNPMHSRAINNLGFILLSESNWDEAEKLFREAEKQGYENPEILKANQGFIALNQYRLEDAKSFYLEALAAISEDDKAILHAAYPCNDDRLRYDHADRFPSRMVNTRTTVLVNLATACALLKEMDQAKAFAQQATEEDVIESSGFRVLGCLYTLEGKVTEACQTWEKALTVNISNDEEVIVRSWISESEHD